jgi:carbamoyl-phosphate synthase large subunit
MATRTAQDTGDRRINTDTIAMLLRNAKEVGFSDKQIAKRWGVTELDVRALRVKHGVTPAVKQIDTLGGEYPATTNYLYTTYNARADDVRFDDHGVLVIGSGTYRIGSSVEFDYCSIKTVHALARLGKRTIMINNNPETVSTDYDENDRLYFDELSLEKVLDIYEKEAAEGVVVSVGGQAPNNIALKLHNAGAKVLGTHPSQIDRCEDRSAYSAMLDKLEIKQPAWCSVTSDEAAINFCKDVGFPVIVRPSYVLSGAAMSVVRSNDELTKLLAEATSVSPDYPVVVSKFVEGAYEVDMDAVANKGEVVAFAISEHLERGGVHSGDATLVLPSFRLTDSSKDVIRRNAAAIAKELNISGPFNTQFLISQKPGEEEWIGVIETNLRASRSVPFVAKVLDVDFISRAASCIMGVDNGQLEPNCMVKPEHTGVKVAQFSFQRLLGSDPVLGVEMHSTGEVACFGETVEEAYLKSLISTHFKLPEAGSSIMICAREGAFGSLEGAVDSASKLASRGFNLVAADEETKAVLAKQGVASEIARDDTINKRGVKLVLDISDNSADFYPTRRSATDFNIPLITNHEQVMLFSRALCSSESLQIKSYDEHVPIVD